MSFILISSQYVSIQIPNMQIVLIYPLKYVYLILNAIAAFYSEDSQNGCNFKHKLWRLKILIIDKDAEKYAFLSSVMYHTVNGEGLIVIYLTPTW